MPVRQYLDNTVVPLLLQAMTEVAKERYLSVEKEGHGHMFPQQGKRSHIPPKDQSLLAFQRQRKNYNKRQQHDKNKERLRDWGWSGRSCGH